MWYIIYVDGEEDCVCQSAADALEEFARHVMGIGWLSSFTKWIALEPGEGEEWSRGVIRVVARAN